MSKDYDTAIIVDDDSDSNNEDDIVVIPKQIRKRQPPTILQKCYNEDPNSIEIGIDEAGRGPLFGRVYTAAVILPKDNSFNHSKMKDSKKFHSKKKIEEVSEYIKEHALAWYVSFEDEKTIDNINILQATQMSMHTSALETRKQYNKVVKEQNKSEFTDYSFFLLVDGNYFNPISYLNKKTNKLEQMKHICIEGGDNKYTAIAAASILAKVERDKYIDDLCKENPHLAEYYGIDSNKGYGAKKHLDGIKEHGITIWHRRSFGICKSYV
jgi:ribonuclease HII